MFASKAVKKHVRPTPSTASGASTDASIEKTSSSPTFTLSDPSPASSSSRTSNVTAAVIRSTSASRSAVTVIVTSSSCAARQPLFLAPSSNCTHASTPSATPTTSSSGSPMLSGALSFIVIEASTASAP